MNETFLAILAVVLFGCLAWGVRVLPQEQWQFMVTAPNHKSGSLWDGVNFTYYGFFSANAYVLAVGICYALIRAVGASAIWAALAMTGLLAVCVPASRIVARVVEKKVHTFTVGGASFVGILFAPWIILLTSRILLRFPDEGPPVTAVMAAFAIAYALGEGMGRLACISFGCCYGRPLSECSPLVRRMFKGRTVVFFGETKKAAYAGGLAGKPLLPVQALTSLLYTTTALVGLWCFLQAYYFLACMGVLVITQLWRFLSEFLRADYRGDGMISRYQWMGMVAIIYTSLVLPLVGDTIASSLPDIATGLSALWGAGPLLSLQLLWVLIFYFMGKSTVTRSTISFDVAQERT